METTVNELTTVTYVTAFFNIYKSFYDEKDFSYRVNLFLLFASTQLNIVVYTDDFYYDQLMEKCKDYINVKIYTIGSVYNTEIFNIAKPYIPLLSLPEVRTEKKDTVEYMLLMISKVEFVNNCVVENPFKTSHFAWIDFNIFFIFKDCEKCSNQLKHIASCKNLQDTLIVPGIWKHHPNINTILYCICWKWTGGFFIGSASKITQFFKLHKTYFPIFLSSYRKIVWEVNFWSWLDMFGKQVQYNNNKLTQIKDINILDFNMIWYESDHNDTIINIPDYLLGI